MAEALAAVSPGGEAPLTEAIVQTIGDIDPEDVAGNPIIIIITTGLDTCEANAAEQLARHAHPGMVVVLESTTYPGTTREVLVPKLTEEAGLTVGEQIFICFSPERVDPGRKDWTTLNTPKVIGGITPACAEVAA